jgi:HK97 family phage portal protein
VVLEKLIGFAERVGGVLPGVKRASRVSPALSSPWERELGVGQSWMPLSYGEYYPRSALVYSAIKIRQDAVARVPLRVYRGKARGPGPGMRGVPTGPDVETVGASHPVQGLLDSPNPFWTRGDLWRATETYLGLWGSAFWGLERDEAGRVVEVWPLRSDRMRVVPDSQRYVKGFVYAGQGQQMVSYVPEDIVWLRYFNPLDEFSGLSPMAPLRLSADMAIDALRANRNGLSNDSSPGLFIETSDTPTDDEVREFCERWESRYRGVDKVRRPALLSGGMKASNLGFSPRDMEYVRSLRWGLEDVSRVFGVPKPMLSDVERITFSNLSTSRKIFWEDTIVPQLMFYEEALNRRLLPQVEDSELFVEFDTATIEALRESENDKASRRQGYVRTGIMTVNEVRREMNLPPVDWGDGAGG